MRVVKVANYIFLLTFVWLSPISPSFGVYISQLIRFARVCSNDDDFNNRNLFLTAKLLKQGYRFYKIRKAFSKFYHRHSELIVQYNIWLKLFCNKAYKNLYFMVIQFINSNELLENLILVINSKKIVKRYIRVGKHATICILVLNPNTVIAMVSSLIARRWVRLQTMTALA